MKREIIDLASYRAARLGTTEDIIPQGIITRIEQEVRIATGVQFSPKSRQIIVAAEEEAIAFNQPYVGTEHLLLALLREEFFSEQFRFVGINRELMERILLNHGQKSDQPTKLRGYTNRLTEIAMRRADIAQERSMHYRKIIAVEWPLGLLNRSDGIGVDLMHRTGLDTWRDQEAFLLRQRLSAEFAKPE